MTETLKEDIDLLEEACIVPPQNQEFFRSSYYGIAKRDLDIAIASEGRDISSARKAGTGMSAFLLSNASRMIGCKTKRFSIRQ